MKKVEIRSKDTKINEIKLPIYLDYAATTPVDPVVAEEMCAYLTLTGVFGNASSRSHRFGWEAEEAVERAREQVAALIHADSREIIFTSGATESNNLALKGAAHFYASKGRHIITCKTEHKAVLDPCRQLEQEGFTVTYLDPESSGRVSLDRVREALTPETILLSFMWVNNEIGVMHDIAALSALAREAKVLLHVDAAQAVGKISVDLQAVPVDLLSISAHKLYGPKGIGALYLRRQPRVRLQAQVHGGGQERGIRSGTLPVHQIVGFGRACALASLQQVQEHQQGLVLRQQLWEGLRQIEGVTLNGDLEHGVPTILNLSFSHIEGESLMMALEEIALSSGSACTSSTLSPSYVIQALGHPIEVAHSSLRFSFGRYTTAPEIAYTVKRVTEAVAHLRALSPLWEMHQQGIDLKTIAWTAH